MNLEESKKWTGYIAGLYSEKEMADFGVLLGEDTIMSTQRNESGTQWKITLQKLVSIENLAYSPKIAKKFLKITGTIFDNHRMDGYIVEAEDGSCTIVGEMQIVGIFDQLQLDGLLSQFNLGPIKAMDAFLAKVR
jgi:hypothetical protein